MTPRIIVAVVLTLAVSAPLWSEHMGTTIEAVKARHEASILALPGVVSVGIGRARDGGLAILVGIRPGADVELPERIEGYAVEGITVSPPQAQ